MPDLLRLRAEAKEAGAKTKPKAVAGDKAYHSSNIRQWLQQRHIDDVIPTRKNERCHGGFKQSLYRRRNIIERVIGWLAARIFQTAGIQQVLEQGPVTGWRDRLIVLLEDFVRFRD